MYSVMIVDDYEMFRQEIQSMDVWGEASGFIITNEASNGSDALTKLRDRPVDLLLTDIRMPYINGLELLKAVRDEKLCTCVVLMSQFGDFEYARQGLSNGAFEYLLKPLDPNELLACLLRAAKYIHARNLEIEKINHLDKILNKSSEEYFPESVNNLLSLIDDGNPNALNTAASLVDAIFSEVGTDTFKTFHILNRLTNKLITSVQNEYKWLDKFINFQNLRISDISAESDYSSIKESFVRKVDIILTTIREFELGIDNSSMVRMVCRTILENIDSEITVSEIANRLFITRTYLSQIFKEKTGMKIVDYLSNVSIQRAKMLILGGSSIDEILEKLGYRDFEYFKKLFKKATGMTINEFRNG